MFLLTGPPGSGKTSQCLDVLRGALRQAPDSCRLLVPTATMAEHLRNELAREGLVFRPGAVATFSKFVSGFVPDIPGVTTSTLELFVDRLLTTMPLTDFAGLRDAPGFRRSVVSAIEEFSAAGGTVGQLRGSGVWPDFSEIYAAVGRALKPLGKMLRGDRLRVAAERIGTNAFEPMQSILVAGFYGFTAPELQVLHALDSKCRLTITLPDWSGAQFALSALRGVPDSAEERASERAHWDIPRAILAAPAADQEVAGIARMILEERSAGRGFREMGIIVRTEDPYVPALRSVLKRFGIPARFYFGAPLGGHSAVRYLSGLLEAMLSDWDYSRTLQALRLQGSPLAGHVGDDFEHRVSEAAPGNGLPGLSNLAQDDLRGFFDDLSKLDAWRDGTFAPTVWAKRFRTLRALYRHPEITPGDHESVLVLREQAAALNSFEAAFEEAAAFDAAAPISCREFWRRVQLVISGQALRPPDHRRDVVHVIDATEARQWRLPVVFACGLLEKQFPRYHSEHPILPDAVRTRLRQSGVWLATSTERQHDEKFLFDVVSSRATQRITFSYPRLNSKGEENLASFFLDLVRERALEEPVRDVRPQPSRSRAPEPHAAIADPVLRTALAVTHKTIRATAIESYLQCPYQFFAQSSLRLKAAPDRLWDRLNPLAQGNIAHTALELAFTNDCGMDEAFNEAFQAYCDDKNVPDSYRREAVRLELLHNLLLLERDQRLARGAQTLVEQDFSLQIDAHTTIRGRIDRMEIEPDGRVTVVDYKYRSSDRIRETKRAHAEQRTLVQGGLYLLAVPQLGDYVPAGMVYCGFKRDVTYAGWVLRPSLHQFPEDCGDSNLEPLMMNAKEDALRAAAEIRAGTIVPKPADEERCAFCAYANSCRVESMTEEQAIGAGETWG